MSIPEHFLTLHGEDFVSVMHFRQQLPRTWNICYTIGKNAFKKCTKLKTAVIGKSVKTIKAKAFTKDNKIKKITFKGKKLKTVKKNALSSKVKKNIKAKKTKLKGNKKAIKVFKKKLKIK